MRLYAVITYKRGGHRDSLVTIDLYRRLKEIGIHPTFCSRRIEQLIDDVQAAFDRRPTEIESGLDVEDAALLQLLTYISEHTAGKQHPLSKE